MLAVSRLHGKLATGKHDSPKEKGLHVLSLVKIPAYD